jgi:hypothetical protein
MSVHQMALVWKLRGLTPAQKFVLMKYADCADDDGRNAFPSVRTVAEACGMSERNTQITIRWLSESGYLVREADPGYRRPSTYRLDLTVKKGATVSPFPEKGAIAVGETFAPMATGEGCNPGPRRVQSDAEKGAKSDTPKRNDPSGSVREIPHTPSRAREANPPPLTPAPLWSFNRRALTASGVMAGTLPRDHLTCQRPCGRVCIHESQFAEFVRLWPGDDPDEKATATTAWVADVNAAWGPGGARANDVPQANRFDFWRDRWNERWPKQPPARAAPPGSGRTGAPKRGKYAGISLRDEAMP